MKTLKIMSLFGTRPEAVKMCPLILQLNKTAGVQSLVCLTGQHREILDPVMAHFGIRPDYDLRIMRPRQTPGSITCDVLEKLEPILRQEHPNLVLVHGDTSSSLAAALAAFYQKIPVGHVEAGLRSRSRYSPYPEEMNRLLTDRIATLHFAPTAQNRENLAREGITDKVFVTGNTVIDALQSTVRPDYRFQSPELAALKLSAGRTILMTAHRRENLGRPLENICRAALRLAQDFPDIRIIYPVHLNPAVRENVQSILQGQPRVHLIEPLDVADMHNLIARSFLVLTDSGGLQEEAPSCGVPVLVMRTETERPEAVEAGTVKVVGVEEDGIYRAAHTLLTDEKSYRAMAHAVNPYGDGHASERIVRHLLEWAEN